MQNIEVVVESVINSDEVGIAQKSDGQRVSFMFSRLRHAGYAYRDSHGVHVIDPRIVPGVKLIVDIELQDHARPRVTTIREVVGIIKNSDCRRLTVDERGIGSLHWDSGRAFGLLKVTHLQNGDALLPVEPHTYKDLFVHIRDVNLKVRDNLVTAEAFAFIVIPRRNGDVCGKITGNH